MALDHPAAFLDLLRDRSGWANDLAGRGWRRCYMTRLRRAIPRPVPEPSSGRGRERAALRSDARMSITTYLLN
jgi:hypothetical protein